MKNISLLALLTVSCLAPTGKDAFVPALDAVFTQQIDPNGPGGAILLMHDSTIIYTKGLGLADLETREKITPQTLFNIGSISKTFVSNGILILHGQGKLSVEDPLSKYFPGFKNRAIAERVKIKHLLTHTSGLPDNRQVNKDSIFYLTADDSQNWFPITQTDTLEFEPGTRYHYSNPAFNALALIIEQVTNQKWQAFIKEKIFNPSGMAASTITDGPHPRTGVSHGYTKIGNVWKEDDFGEEPTFCAAGNGGVWSSVEELAAYEVALRNAVFVDMALLDESALIKTFPGWSGEKPPFIGWAWFIDQTNDGDKIICHTGHQGGFASYYISIPSKKIFFVVLYNAPYDVYALRKNVLDLLQEYNWLR
ncbi:MAG: serine hydrolase domain-containing protein [Cytophagales bacterium]|nr:serine hydrolase domain-containing protein [Cytophagales bacterium]